MALVQSVSGEIEILDDRVRLLLYLRVANGRLVWEKNQMIIRLRSDKPLIFDPIYMNNDIGYQISRGEETSRGGSAGIEISAKIPTLPEMSANINAEGSMTSTYGRTDQYFDFQPGQRMSAGKFYYFSGVLNTKEIKPLLDGSGTMTLVINFVASDMHWLKTIFTLWADYGATVNESLPLVPEYRYVLPQSYAATQLTKLKKSLHRYASRDLHLIADDEADKVDPPQDFASPPPPSIVDLYGEDADETPQKMLFEDAYQHYKGRLLLLGNPGAGKTTTLMRFAVTAFEKWQQNPTNPLPILERITTWEAGEQPSLTDWLAVRTQFSPLYLAQLAKQQKVLLLLDGLDELGSDRIEKDEKGNEIHYDPRERFLKILPRDNALVISCRVIDYDDLARKQRLTLNGAVKLEPLEPEQIQAYLSDLPELWQAIEQDAPLLELARTPFFLRIIAFAFRDAPQDLKQRGDLSATQLRNVIFDRYVDENYNYYKRRHKQDPAFTLQEIKDVLGHVAMINASGGRRRGKGYSRIVDNVLEERDFAEVFATLHFTQEVESSRGARHESTLQIPNQINDFISLAQTLNLIVSNDNQTQRFIHLLLRDYFAYQYSLLRLEDETLYADYYELSPAKALGTAAKNDASVTQKLVDLLNNQQKWRTIRRDVAEALGIIGSETAVQPLILVLYNQDDDSDVRRYVASALGIIGSEQAIQPLISVLHNQDDDSDVRQYAASALGSIGGETAAQALIAVLNNHDDNSSVWESAATALSYIGGEQAIEALIYVLTDTTRTSFWDVVAEALERIGTPEALESVRRWREEQGYDDDDHNWDDEEYDDDDEYNDDDDDVYYDDDWDDDDFDDDEI